ncbi:MAG: 3-isopropylmalate dehydratase small subunit [Candidatus Adiutrix sp.]|jgi:3-isopropylmalate/(R)-2-methylmalate dehydratase small subunit|nr:3-isopropylmalate dehydratase small subunit [Candidatus Adiutrix sp.]
MEKFTTLTTVAAVLNRPNVDTDLIIPKQFLKSIERRGYGRFVFYDLRFRPDGSPDPDCPLNRPCCRGAGVLVSRENFGCGSSREHAAWALMDYGFKAVIAPSFGDIFSNNSFKNGLLPVKLPPATVDRLIGLIEERPGLELTLDLAAQTVTGPAGFSAAFDIDPYRKELMLNGWDDISLTLKKASFIEAYEAAHRRPWQAAVDGLARR